MPTAAATKKIRASLLKRLAELTGQAQALGDFRTETGGDACDMAFNATETELTTQLAQHNHHEIASIKLALDKIAAGKYGVCEGCGSKILAARLEALPYSIYCIKCQQQSDRGLLNGRSAKADWGRVDSSPVATEDDDGDRYRNDRMAID